MITLIPFLCLCDSRYFVTHFLLFTKDLMKFLFHVVFFSLFADFDEISGVLSLSIMFSIILVPLAFTFPFTSVICFALFWPLFLLFVAL